MKSPIKNKLKKLLNKTKRFKFVINLVLKFRKSISKDEKRCSTFYSNSKTETVVPHSDVDNLFKSICCTVITKTQYQEEDPR